LELVIAPILFVEQEPQIFNFLSASVSRHDILIVSVVVVIVLHKFLVLDMSVFLLNCVQLVSEGEVVFISLLDFKDFSFQLRDKQILLVACEMHGVVVFSHIVYIEFLIFKL